MSRSRSAGTRSWLFLVAPALFGASSLAFAGCGGRFADYCDAKAQCEGGNDADIDACAAEADSAEAIASAYDCSDAFDKLFDCVERTGDCSHSSYKTNCNDEYSALTDCEQAASAKKGGSVSDTSTNGSTGGGASCAELEGVCASCTGEVATTCQQVVDAGDESSCEQLLSSFTNACAPN